MSRRLAILSVIGLLTVVLASEASAADYLNVCPDMPPDLVSATDDAIETREQGQRDVTICLAVTERLETLVALQEAAIEDEATTQAQRVAFSTPDRNRLDLMWWGVWALVGLSFALLLAPMMWRAFRWWRE